MCFSVLHSWGIAAGYRCALPYQKCCKNRLRFKVSSMEGVKKKKEEEEEEEDSEGFETPFTFGH